MSAADPDGETTPVVLADPVRHRLVQLASDVLASLPAEDVPVSLRTIARFTPAKRIRLGATALAATLDADETFRGRVAEAVATSSPQLVDALRTGATSPVSDPYDRAAVAYLVRPDGWPQLVAEVTAQWAEKRSGRDAAADEIARLRTELAELKSRVKEQDAALDEARAAAGAASAEEFARLRNTVRVRTGELRAATQELQQAQADGARDRAALDAAVAEHEAEASRLRERVSELERAAEAGRREARSERDVDAARLRLLLDTVIDAAAGIRRELALPAAVLRPADLVASAGDAPGGAGAGDPAALDQLLELPHVHLIVDGYNVTKTGYPELSLADQRTRLISALAALQSRSGAEVTVVFDGGRRPPAQPHAPRGVRVLFSAADEIADDLIRRLVAAEPGGRALVVVTADQEVVRDVRRAGAWTVASSVLLRRLG